MVLIREVEQHPDHTSSAQSRAIVDEALSLCGPDGRGITHNDGSMLAVRSLTEGGSEAWDLIWRLRSRSWSKAGADPDVLFSRDEVIEHAQERARKSVVSEDNIERPNTIERAIAVLDDGISSTQLWEQSVDHLAPGGDDAAFGGDETQVIGQFISGTALEAYC